jgi:DNA polymerase-3 subunit gamma/tau
MSSKRSAASAQRSSQPAPSDEYTVLARRYRPQQFRDLVGQEPVAQALTNALQSHRVAHAYLFTGARGVGKTSTARILAKALNCEKGPTATPCDKCSICQSIATGEDVDVLEVDGASNRGIDEIREIRQNVQYRPSRGRYKIYIVDEVHMLTAPAFNALLKTLEEPPAHVKFIFATTEVQKIPITILSRCQRFDFASIGSARIVDRLKEVIASEGRPVDDEALDLIARRAGGSMRDAQSLLDQLLAFGSERVTADQVHHLLGTAHEDRVLGLAAAALAHDAAQALQLVGDAADQGLQLGELVDQLIEYWRDLMVIRCAGDEARGLSVAPRHRATLHQQATALSLDTILAGLDVLTTARSRLRTSSHGRILIEMAMVRLSRLEDLVSVAQLTRQLTGAELPKATAVSSPKLAVRPTVAAPPEALKKNVTPADESTQLITESSDISEWWPRVLRQMGPILSARLEKGGLPAIFGPNALVLRFAAEYNADYEHCLTRLEDVQKTTRAVSGKPWQVRLERDNSAPAPAVAAPQRPWAEVENEPLIRQLVTVLGARAVRKDPDFGAVPASVAEPAESPTPDEE